MEVSQKCCVKVFNKHIRRDQEVNCRDFDILYTMSVNDNLVCLSSIILLVNKYLNSNIKFN